VETASDDEMSMISKNPRDDLPNQESIYTELFIERKQELYIQKGDRETDREK